jgi:glutamate racemase
VIATRGTVDSGAYNRAIRALAPGARVSARACPLLVPLVEEGWLDTDATRLIVSEYLAPLRSDGVDTLVLGCTHYPLLKPVLVEALGDHVCLIDGAHETAAEMARLLDASGLRAPPGRRPAPHRFISSDAPEQFLGLGQRFLGATIERVEQFTIG